MKKEYLEPVLHLLELEGRDVITLSAGDGDNWTDDDFD